MQPAELTGDWVEVGELADIPRLGARVVRAPDGDVAVFRNAEDEAFALLNRCPHMGGPLAEGMVYGRVVTCPLHNWCVELHTGQAVAPDQGCVPRYPVKVVSGRVLLRLTPETTDYTGFGTGLRDL